MFLFYIQSGWGGGGGGGGKGVTSNFLHGGGMDVFWNDSISEAYFPAD